MSTYYNDLLSKAYFDDHAYDSFDSRSVSEIAGVMDQELAALRNQFSDSEKVVTSSIRVTLNRPLTWAEIEDIETDVEDTHLRRIDFFSEVDGFKLTVDRSDHSIVRAESLIGSRLLYNIVAHHLEHNYVNVFPRAVLTKREYNGDK